MVAFERAVIEWDTPPWLAKSRRFTDHEDRAIAMAYRRGWTLKRIAAQCGRHWTTVQGRVQKLLREGRLTERESLRPKPWTRRDLDRLATYWGVWPDDRVAALLGRTVNACKIAATRKLGQARRANVLTASEVARVFGVDRTTVYRGWARRGWVAVYRTPLGNGRGRVYAVDQASLRRFVEEMPWAIDVSRMQPGHWLTALAQQAQAGDPWLTLPEAAALVYVVPNTLQQWCAKGLLPYERRPNWGTTGGNPDGRLVVRRSAVLASAAERDAREAANRSAAVKAWRQRRREQKGQAA